jgi:hypothetical protein
MGQKGTPMERKSRRGKASWELTFDVPSDNGLRKTKYVSVKGRHQDAQRELTGAAIANVLG